MLQATGPTWQAFHSLCNYNSPSQVSGFIPFPVETPVKKACFWHSDVPYRKCVIILQYLVIIMFLCKLCLLYVGVCQLHHPYVLTVNRSHIIIKRDKIIHSYFQRVNVNWMCCFPPLLLLLLLFIFFIIFYPKLLKLLWRHMPLSSLPFIGINRRQTYTKAYE